MTKSDEKCVLCYPSEEAFITFSKKLLFPLLSDKTDKSDRNPSQTPRKVTGIYKSVKKNPTFSRTFWPKTHFYLRGPPSATPVPLTKSGQMGILGLPRRTSDNADQLTGMTPQKVTI